MYKKFLWIITLVSALTFNQMVLADTSVCREGLSTMVQSLNLDANQKQKIQPILDQFKNTAQTAGSQMDGIENQINQQVSTPNMNQDTVNGLVDQKVKLIGDIMKAKIQAKSQILAILNPQQQAKLQGMLKAADDKMKALWRNCTQD